MSALPLAETDRLRLRTDAVEKRLDAIEGWARTSAQRTSFLETMVSEVDGFRMARARQIAGQQRMAEKFVASLSGLIDRVDGLGRDVAAMQEHLAEVRGGAELRSSGLAEQIGGLASRQDMLLRVMSGRSQQMQRISRTLGTPSADRVVDGVVETPDTQDPGGRALDLLYLDFEDRARGSRAEIGERQSVYLPLVEEIGAGTAERPILDLGAGRGEWLEVLRDRGLVARGIDVNEAMVALCSSLGLECGKADALSTLAGLADNSLGMISGFHIIEHLPYDVFVGVIDEALRVLAPGGVLLFETPDPQNVLVGSHNFYMDPTHRNPMPSAMVRIVAEARGFTSVEIRRLHPSDGGFSGQDAELIAQLDALFFGPQDYAMIARKI